MGFASFERYQHRFNAYGFQFHPIRPDLDIGSPELVRKVMNAQDGVAFLFKELVFSQIEQAYEDLCDVLQNYDLLISGMLAPAARLVFEAVNKPWISSFLFPSQMYSVYDFPVLPPLPSISKVLSLHPLSARFLKEIVANEISKWCEPIYDFRKKLGLKKGPNPLIEGFHSPLLSVGLFSNFFSRPQADWPVSCRLSAFIFQEQGLPSQELSVEIKDFVKKHPQPIVVTLGSIAGLSSKTFYRDLAQALKELKQHAIFVTGLPDKVLDDFSEILEVSYAPFNELLPLSKAVFHQAGIGTLAQTLKSLKASLCFPLGLDQYDNANRLQKLGVALAFPFHKLNSNNARTVVQKFMQELPHLEANAMQLGEEIGSENGVELSCQLIQPYL